MTATREQAFIIALRMVENLYAISANRNGQTVDLPNSRHLRYGYMGLDRCARRILRATVFDFRCASRFVISKHLSSIYLLNNLLKQ